MYVCVDRTNVAQLEFILTNIDYGIFTSIYIRSCIILRDIFYAFFLFNDPISFLISRKSVKNLDCDE